MKNISILGSTGSIGQSALNLIGSNLENYNIVGLTANKNVELVKKQVETFRPQVVAMANEDAAASLKKWITTKGDNGLKKIEVFSNQDGLCEVASLNEADFVLSSIVGASGLRPTLAAIKAKKTIGLANKETLVMAGSLVLDEVERNNVTLLPVDSEHSAIFQCLEGRDKNDVRKLLLTASGGPFFGKKREELSAVTAEDALRHPNWSMGSKITVDSATLMNKGLEVIEAHYLFGFNPGLIDVIVHPQSIIHSMIELKDGSIISQMSVPDMKGPIGYALSYPNRIENAMELCRLEDIKTLTFHPPDKEAFPCLNLAYDALSEGGTMPTVLNAANEEVVDMFLKGAIGFSQIPAIIEYIMEKHTNNGTIDMENIFESDNWARNAVKEKMKEELK